MKNTRMQAWLTRPGGLASALRSARGELSTREFATALGGNWTSPKVSKLENGTQFPTSDEVSAWADAARVDGETRSHLHKLHADAARMRSTFTRRTAGGSQAVGDEGDGLEAGASWVRVVDIAAIPELLQVEAYTRALRPGLTDATMSGLKARQEHVRAKGKRFQFLISEAALLMVRGDRDVMAEQLDRLLGACGLKNVELGFIPLLTTLHAPPAHSSIAVYDTDEAVTFDGVQEHRYVGSSVEVWHDRINAMWQDAVTGPAARKLILNAIEDLPEN